MSWHLGTLVFSYIEIIPQPAGLHRAHLDKGDGNDCDNVLEKSREQFPCYQFSFYIPSEREYINGFRQEI